MPQLKTSFRHPFDFARYPTIEPEVKRAILASWISDRSAVTDQLSLRRPLAQKNPVPVDDVLAALKSLDARTLLRSDRP